MLPFMAQANPSSLFSETTPRRALLETGTARGALVPASHSANGANKSGSLFAGVQQNSLFAPVPARPKPNRPGGYSRNGRPNGLLRDFGIVGLQNLIARAEAGSAQYDAVVWSARIKPPKPPSQMRVEEIYRWIQQTPGQNHAIGRYQFIPKTLRSLVRRAGLNTKTRFSPQVQDQLAHLLFEDAGLSRFLNGDISRTAFMNNLAKIWAGLPTSNGRSHYHGYAGNKSTLSWGEFQAAMVQFFPSG